MELTAKSQEERRSNMKKQAFGTFAILTLLLTVSAISVSAQSQRSKITNIPFDFVVGGQTLPAGEYTVEPNRKDSLNVWLIQSRDGHVQALFATNSVRSSETQEQTKFVFNKYGDQYFLSQIWTIGGNNGRELPKPRLERALAKNSTRQTIMLAGN
jgi:hypothetical protein